MVGEVGAFDVEVVGLGDLAARTDEVAVAAGHAEVEVGLALLPLDVVRLADLLRRVGKKLVRETLVVGERLLLVDGVERGTQDDGAGVGYL